MLHNQEVEMKRCRVTDEKRKQEQKQLRFAASRKVNDADVILRR